MTSHGGDPNHTDTTHHARHHPTGHGTTLKGPPWPIQPDDHAKTTPHPGQLPTNRRWTTKLPVPHRHHTPPQNRARPPTPKETVTE